MTQKCKIIMVLMSFLYNSANFCIIFCCHFVLLFSVLFFVFIAPITCTQVFFVFFFCHTSNHHLMFFPGVTIIIINYGFQSARKLFFNFFQTSPLAPCTTPTACHYLFPHVAVLPSRRGQFLY